ncbi:hypothetical protein [Rubritalea tangerina]|uniref:hypothetical protein n=1 Tax=Rubritalea tangerina TaxID=430798 RepID=UPI0036080E63
MLISIGGSNRHRLKRRKKSPLSSQIVKNFTSSVDFGSCLENWVADMGGGVV